MKKTVITIGRQYGSGGHEVGVRLSAKLGIPLYDKEMITLTAEKSKLAEDYLEENEEIAPSIFRGVYTHGAAMGFYAQTPSEIIFIEQSKLIRQLADKGPCVIVGRCADYVLKEKNPLNVFIQASFENRVARKAALWKDENLPLAEVEKQVRAIDKRRVKYYEYYTDQRFGDSANFHLCIDTGRCGIDGAVDTIVAYLNHMDASNTLPD